MPIQLFANVQDIEDNTEAQGYRIGDSLELLRENIRTNGIQSPLVLEHLNGRLQLTAGFRRLACCKQLGITQVPVRIRMRFDL